MWFHKYSVLRLVMGFLGLSSAGFAALAPGDPLPDLTTYPLQGDLPDLEGKVVLLDFWASWCPPCKKSFPSFDEMQRELTDAGLVILAVSVDRRERDYTKFIERMQPGFATVLDAGQALVADLEPTVMPTSFLFGRDGRLRSVHTGFHGERTVQELTAEITQLLQEDAP